MGDQYTGNSYAGADTGGGGGGNTTIINNQNITQRIESFPFVFIDASLSIDAANLTTYRGKSIVYAEATNGEAAINLPAADATTSYPLIFGFEHLGGTTRTDTNLLSIRAHGVETIDEGGVPITTAIALERGDVAYIERASATSAWEISRVSASAGADGPQGPRGIPGADGASITGPRGIPGQSITGPMGTPGADGASITGPQGIPGTDGARGVMGVMGDQGPRGIPGTDGASITGPRGIAGTDGTDGIDGVGIQGVKGDKGDQGDPGTGTGGGTALTTGQADFLKQITEADDDNKPEIDAAIATTRWWALDTSPRTVPPTGDAVIGRFSATDSEYNKLLFVALPANQATEGLHINVENAITSEAALHAPFDDYFTDYSAIIAPTGGFKFFIYGPSTLAPTRIIISPAIAYEIFKSTTAKKYTASASVDFTANVDDLTSAQLDFPAQVALDHGISVAAEDFIRLDGLEVAKTTSDLAEQPAFLWKIGGPVFTVAAYSLFEQATGLLPLPLPTAITVLVPFGSTSVSLHDKTTTTIEIDLVNIGEIIITGADGRRTSFDAYSATLPATAGRAYSVRGTASATHLSGAESSFKIGVDNLGQVLAEKINHDDDLPVVLTQLASHLSTSTVTSGSSTWTSIDPPPILPHINLLAAAFWIENRSTISTNFFTGTNDVEITASRFNKAFYETARGQTTPWVGHPSVVLDAPFSIANGTGSLVLTALPEKIYSMEYFLREAPSAGTHEMFRIGATGEPLIILDSVNGLQVRVRRGGSGTTLTRSVDTPLPIDPPHVSNTYGGSDTGINRGENVEFAVEIPADATGAYSFNFAVRRFVNDADLGVQNAAVAIPNVAVANAAVATFTTSWGLIDQVWTVHYDPSVTKLGRQRRECYLRTTIIPRTTTYTARATHRITQTYTIPTTYGSVPINAGSAIGNGVFDVRNFNTLRPGYGNRIMVVFEREVRGDTSLDPALAIRVIVDGELKDRVILNRLASDFDFRIGTFGATIAALFSHFQTGSYDPEDRVSASDFVKLYEGHSNDPAYGALGFGVVNPPHLTRRAAFRLNTGLELLRPNGDVLDVGALLSSEMHGYAARNSNQPPDETMIQPIQNGGLAFGRSGHFGLVTLTLLTTGTIPPGAVARFGFVRSSSNTAGLSISDVVAGTEFDVPLLGLHTVFPKLYLPSQATFGPMDRVDFILISSTNNITIRVGTISWLLSFNVPAGG